MRLRQHGLVLLLSLSFGLAGGASTAMAATDFAAIVEATSPSVVNISATSRSRPVNNVNEEFQELLRRFYGIETQPESPRARQSFGSGFIISNEGYVLTNNHVIDGADSVMVRLNDRREIEAKVIGTDPRTDIALLKIDAKSINAVKIGDPSKLRVGEAVLAIGSPFGFDYSATAGIVSAKSRALPSEAYVPFIQTDVAINPGNSGGPLFNANGEVIGINSQIYSRSGGFMGVSFAIPIDVAMEVVAQLQDQGKVNRGYLGVAIQEVTKNLADAYGLSRPAGALIANVEPGSPADKAGLKQGDVVVRFDNKSINLAAELPQAIGRATVGESYDLNIVRDRKPVLLKVKIEPIPEEAVPVAETTTKTPDLSRLGMTLRDLQAPEKARLKLEGGALVTRVVAGSGADSGLVVGDVITRVANKPINTAREFVAEVRKLSANATVPITVNRRGTNIILALKLEPEDAAR
ncbi:MAG: Do family serine endopeptidase [Moraxellaceae bacterium]|nr:Do family serine endopeptidase [Moraxellaceae bacterium]